MIVYPSDSTLIVLLGVTVVLGDADVCICCVQPPCEWAANADSLRPVVNCQCYHQLVG